MPTVSAHPVRLFAFTGSTQRRRRTVQGIARDLDDLLRALPSRCPGVAAPGLAAEVDDVGDDLGRVADFVDQVARAVLDADSSWLTRYADLAANLRGLHVAWRVATGAAPAAGGVTATFLAGKALADARGVLDQGDPIGAFGRRGTDYLADLAQLPLDALLIEVGLRPSPQTAVAAFVGFRVWAELATWDERRRAALAGVHAADLAQDAVRNAAVTGFERVTGWLRSQLDGRARQGDPGPIVVPPPLPLPRPVRRIVVGALDRADAAVETADHAVDEVAEAARTVSHAVGAVADHLPWNR
ncbi:MAG: hypothetical protein JO291_00265 [Acidimicrobiia bacterium]|nr:hypothetical protein [Acidimicrobiia bacterium]